jgi:hypothetical protein
MHSILINLSLFKAGWLASVFTAAASVPAAGAAVVAVVVAVHLLRADDTRPEFELLLFAALLGLGWESLLVSLGLVQYSAGSPIPGMAPYWIVGMWVLFATTINFGMRWLHKNIAVAAIAGAIGGPLSFAAGAKVGAVSFPNPQLSLLIIASGWALLLPLLVRFAARGHANAAHTGVTRPVTADRSPANDS